MVSSYEMCLVPVVMENNFGIKVLGENVFILLWFGPTVITARNWL